MHRSFGWPLLAVTSMLFVSFLFLFAGPGHAASSVRYMMFDGSLREYRVNVPSTVTVATPIVIGLHGGALGNAYQFEKNSGISEYTDSRGFVAVYPQGITNAWNAGDCCGRPTNRDIDDVGFIAAVVADVQDRDGALGAVFATGMSNGAMMAYRLACDSADLVQAVAPVAGNISSWPCEPSNPVGVLQIHGMLDENFPYDGGYPTKGLNTSDERASIPAGIELWAWEDNCETPPSPLSASLRVGEMETAGVGCDAPTILVTLEEAGHTWPGDDNVFASLVVDPAYPDYDATQRLLDFFLNEF